MEDKIEPGHKLYFIQDKRGFVGNSVLWWARASQGYTCDIRGAEMFTEEEALKIVRGRSTDVAYPVEAIMPLAQLHIDMQDLRGKRKLPHTLDRLTK